jgi:hypothetical protein
MPRLSLLLSLAVALPAFPQGTSEKIPVLVVGFEDASPVAKALINKLEASKPFRVVANADADGSAIKVLLKCMPVNSKGSLACSYTSHQSGLTFDMFLGGGVGVYVDPESAATLMLGAVAADIVERYNDLGKQNLKKMLESCLLLTASTCNVPEPLQNEFNATQLTLGQFLLKKAPQP